MHPRQAPCWARGPSLEPPASGGRGERQRGQVPGAGSELLGLCASPRPRGVGESPGVGDAAGQVFRSRQGGTGPQEQG